jgi:hypothetical protein
LVSLDTADRTDWLERLSSFEITLLRDGAEVDRGIAANVLGGPVPALRHLLRGLVDDPHGRGLEAGRSPAWRSIFHDDRALLCLDPEWATVTIP